MAIPLLLIREKKFIFYVFLFYTRFTLVPYTFSYVLLLYEFGSAITIEEYWAKRGMSCFCKQNVVFLKDTESVSE